MWTQPTLQLDRHEAIELEAKVARLRQPRTYPENPREVSTIETHMSWVFLTDAHAYKLKKPVCCDYLDFSTLAARERNCREEPRLNQRLAPGVYLAVMPLVADVSGAVRIAGQGTVIEWLVKMRRFPSGRMLPHLIGTHALQEEDNAPQRLRDFYMAHRARGVGQVAARRVEISSPGAELLSVALDFQQLHD